MRFKSFVWPHNPRTYTITYERDMASFKVPFGRYYLQNLGLTRRVLRGVGEFAGERAYEQFKELASLFYEETPGILVHPVWTTTTAWFVGLWAEQEPVKDYVRYSFEFWETYEEVTGKLGQTALTPSGTVTEAGSGSGGASGNASDSAAAYHTVARGDTLWDIANAYDVGLAQIIAWNPDIKNPNLIYPGQKVRVS